MVLELHVWGPAFGLPSIDAQSLATVAYFTHCLPPTEWRLVPSRDPSVGPTDELPALRSDTTWIYGFRGIINFLRVHSEKWDLDQDLNKQQRADSIAFTSFLESRGQPLLDLSLFVSSENYVQWTRPALAQILRWPNQWIVPHRLRDDAKVRSEHLGLSSLDIESASNEDRDLNATSVGHIPKNLVAKPKDTVVSKLAKTGHQNQFRLDAVTSDFFEPLYELVKKNGIHSWVFGTDRATSLDCLVLGYISLMIPPLTPPQPWLQDALSTRYSALLEWTTNFRQESFGGPISAVDILSPPNLPSSPGHLPWHPRSPVSAQSVGLTILSATFDSLPIVSRFRPDRVVRVPRQTADRGAIDASAVVPAAKRPLYSGLGMAGSMVGAFAAYLFYVGLFSPKGTGQPALNLQGRRNLTRQRDFGEAGRMLGLV